MTSCTYREKVSKNFELYGELHGDQDTDYRLDTQTPSKRGFYVANIGVTACNR